jgi:hypothetical protein
MDRPFHDCIDLARHYNREEFLETDVYGVRGLTHISYADKLAQIPELANEGLVQIGPNSINVLPHVISVGQATAGMKRISDILIQHGIIKRKNGKGPEMCRLSQDWDERHWALIEPLTPVYDRDQRKVWGLPAFTTHCFGMAMDKNMRFHSIHGVSGKNGSGGKYDFFFGGNTPAHLSSMEGLVEEADQETGGIVKLDPRLRFKLEDGIRRDVNPLLTTTFHTHCQTGDAIRIGCRKLFYTEVPFGIEKTLNEAVEKARLAGEDIEIDRFVSIPVDAMVNDWRSGDPHAQYAAGKFKHAVPLAMIALLIQRPLLHFNGFGRELLELNKKVFEVGELSGRTRPSPHVTPGASPQLAAD